MFSLMLLMLHFIMWFMFLSNMSSSYQVLVKENRTHSTVHYKWIWPKKLLASNNRGKPKVRIRAKFIFIHSLNHHRLTIYMYKNFQSIIELLNHIFEIGLIKWYNVNGIVIVLDFPIDWKERFVSWGWIFYALFLGFTAFTSYT